MRSACRGIHRMCSHMEYRRPFRRTHKAALVPSLHAPLVRISTLSRSHFPLPHLPKHFPVLLLIPSFYLPLAFCILLSAIGFRYYCVRWGRSNDKPVPPDATEPTTSWFSGALLWHSDSGSAAFPRCPVCQRIISCCSLSSVPVCPRDTSRAFRGSIYDVSRNAPAQMWGRGTPKHIVFV